MSIWAISSLLLQNLKWSLHIPLCQPNLLDSCWIWHLIINGLIILWTSTFNHFRLSRCWMMIIIGFEFLIWGQFSLFLCNTAWSCLTYYVTNGARRSWLVHFSTFGMPHVRSLLTSGLGKSLCESWLVWEKKLWPAEWPIYPSMHSTWSSWGNGCHWFMMGIKGSSLRPAHALLVLLWKSHSADIAARIL